MTFLCEGLLKIDEANEADKDGEAFKSATSSKSAAGGVQGRRLDRDQAEKIKRFFKIACSLHFDLQMVLSIRSQGLSSNFITLSERQVAIRELAQFYFI